MEQPIDIDDEESEVEEDIKLVSASGPFNEQQKHWFPDKNKHYTILLNTDSYVSPNDA